MERLVRTAMMDRIGNPVPLQAQKTQHQRLIDRSLGNRAHLTVRAERLRRAGQQMVKPGADHISLLAEQVHNGNSPPTMLEGFHGNQ